MLTSIFLATTLSTNPLADLTEKAGKAKTIVVKLTVTEEPQAPEFVGQKLTYSIDKVKNRFCVRNSDGSFAAAFDGKEVIHRAGGNEQKMPISEGKTPFGVIPGFDAFLDPKQTKWKSEVNKKQNGGKEVVITTPVGTLTKTVVFTFGKGGVLQGYSNTNGTYLADRMTIDSIQFDVPIPDSDLIMPKKSN
jgi:hypothetical protein